MTLDYESKRPAYGATWAWQRGPGTVSVTVEHAPQVRRRRMGVGAVVLSVAGTGLAAVACGVAVSETGRACVAAVVIVGWSGYFLVRGLASRRETAERTTLEADAGGVRVRNVDVLPDGSERVDVAGVSLRGVVTYGDADFYVPAATVRAVRFAAMGEGCHLAVVNEAGVPAGLWLPAGEAEAAEVAAALREVLGVEA